jgi:hypothetical protein
MTAITVRKYRLRWAGHVDEWMSCDNQRRFGAVAGERSVQEILRTGLTRAVKHCLEEQLIANIPFGSKYTH